ncbi:hypothetical protein BYT27DRAFT_7259036 [Phlegmacium glaucopus]|nr:hypothetical protein BYT27DRAFT_7259036 [Phlegmacium glaucopus]
MPTTSQKQQIAAAHAKGQEALTEKRAILASETATNDILSRLQAANSHIEVLEQLLSQKEIECGRLQSELEKCNENLQKHKDSSALWKEKHEKTYHELQEQLEIIKIAEKEASKQLLRGSHESYQALISLIKKNKDLQRELSKSVAVWSSQLEKTHAKLATSNLDLKTLFHHLMCKGVFTEETHNVVHLLVKAGCSHKYINKIISAVLKSAGITTVGTISRPSISQILREGFFAAQIQLGYEIKGAERMTFSADGTSHHSINYNSCHVHLVVDDYTSPDSNLKQRVTRTFGIQSLRDGSSKEAIADWENILKKIIDLYNESPLGKRSGILLKYVDLLIKLAGMNTDHCSKEKKDARLLEELKAWAVDQHLGGGLYTPPRLPGGILVDSYLFLLESWRNPTIPGRNTRIPGGISHQSISPEIDIPGSSQSRRIPGGFLVHNQIDTRIPGIP